MIIKYIRILVLMGISTLSYGNLIEFRSHKAAGDEGLGGSLTVDFLQKIKKAFGNSVFVETGTYDGGTTRKAAKIFDQVYSVELHKGLYHKAQKALHDFDNILLSQGESPIFLKNIVNSLTKSAIFWLDAHQSGPDTAMGKQVTPILEELKALQGVPSDSIVIIDDIRLFGVKINDKEWPGHPGYPTVQELCVYLKQINTHYSFAWLGDMLLAFDPELHEFPGSPIARSLTISFLYDGTNFDENQVVAAETFISGISGNELIFFKMMSTMPRSFHYDLWNGLIALKNRESQKALSQFKKVIDAGYDDERIINYWNEALRIS